MAEHAPSTARETRLEKFIPEKLRGDVARSVKDSDDFDSVFHGTIEDEIAAHGDESEVRGDLIHGFAEERLSRELLGNSVKAIQDMREGPTIARIAVAASTPLPGTPGLGIVRP